MITNTRNEIIDYIRDHGQARVKDIYETFKISKVAIHKQLKKLLAEELIVRVGKSPLTFYTLPQPTPITPSKSLDRLTTLQKQIIETRLSFNYS
jgi:DeoR/GlpR family transcriptional regulator of sugar metabolism